MSAKKIAIVQSNYIPWKGYFDLIHSVDEFILFDDAQFTRRDWRNRNKIKTKDGLRWLTIPVEVKGKYHQKINETRVCDPAWGQEHFVTLRHNYSRARYFKDYEDLFADLYLNTSSVYLSEINRRFLEAVCRALGITTKISPSSDYRLVEGKTERLIEMCQQAGADHYVSGPAARSYLDEGQFAREGIGVSYMDYSGYPEYPQLFPPFEHGVSVVDLIFNTGPAAAKYMKTFT